LIIKSIAGNIVAAGEDSILNLKHYFIIS